jgi:hypothetical protein
MVRAPFGETIAERRVATACSRPLAWWHAPNTRRSTPDSARARRGHVDALDDVHEIGTAKRPQRARNGLEKPSRTLLPDFRWNCEQLRTGGKTRENARDRGRLFPAVPGTRDRKRTAAAGEGDRRGWQPCTGGGAVSGGRWRGSTRDSAFLWSSAACCRTGDRRTGHLRARLLIGGEISGRVGAYTAQFRSADYPD